MKSIVKSLIAATALVLTAGTAYAQGKPYVQADLGASVPSGQLGTSINFGGHVGLPLNKYLAVDFSLIQNSMFPSTWLGGANSTEFKFSPLVALPVHSSVNLVVGPTVGAALMSGPATNNNMVGVYGLVAGVEFKTGWEGFSIVPSYAYTRSMVPAITTGPYNQDYYNVNTFTVGFKKSF